MFFWYGYRTFSIYYSVYFVIFLPLDVFSIFPSLIKRGSISFSTVCSLSHSWSEIVFNPIGFSVFCSMSRYFW